MRQGVFVNQMKGYPFVKIEKDNPEIDIKKNIQTFKRIVTNLPPNVGALAFNMESPFACNFPIEKSPLGLFQEDLSFIGKELKEKNVRLVSIFKDQNFGLANKDRKYVEKTQKYIINFSELFDLMQLDFENLVFIPYGDEYVCDFHVFQSNLFELPKYAIRRVAIRDVDNFRSMIIADHKKLPWMYQTNTGEDFSQSIYNHCLRSFANFSLRPNARPVAFGESFDVSLDNELQELHFVDTKLNEKILKKKIRLKNAGARPKLSRKVSKKNRPTKKSAS